MRSFPAPLLIFLYFLVSTALAERECTSPKVPVCHRGKATICLTETRIDSHIRRHPGSTLGVCPEDEEEENPPLEAPVCEQDIGRAETKYQVCHHGKERCYTARVARLHHQRHGDPYGPCPEMPETEPTIPIDASRCGSNGERVLICHRGRKTLCMRPDTAQRLVSRYESVSFYGECPTDSSSGGQGPGNNNAGGNGGGQGPGNNNAGGNGGGDEEGDDDTCTKVTICHRGVNTLSICEDSVAEHIAHGDVEGECEAGSGPGQGQGPGNNNAGGNGGPKE